MLIAMSVLFTERNNVLYTLILMLSMNFPVLESSLPNGLDIIIGEDHSSPIVTVCIVVNTGATCETPEINGLAHFYEHMFFKGNAALPDQTAYNNRMRELGMIRNGTTGSEVVRYYLTVSSDLFSEGLEFMYDAITGPLFNPEEIIRERSVIMNEYERGTCNPFWNLQLMMEEVLTVEPWRSSAIGSPEVIMAADQEVMLMFQEKYYTPDNSALIITGDIDAETVMPVVADLFGQWEYGGRSDYFSLDLNISIEKDTALYVGGPEGMGIVRIVYVGPSMANQQNWTYAADVWGQYMGRMTGEFHNDLVANGPFLNAYASYYSQRFEPTVTFTGIIDPSLVDEGLEMMREEIQDMFREEYFTSSGIETASEQLRRARLFKEESSRDMATKTFPFWWVEGGGLAYYNNYPDSLAAVTADDISLYLDRWVKDKPSAVFLVTPEGEWVE
ncbi:MAG: insulinase family protein [Candidatus Sabulitectum sp.]|nr:insulinase family protein [Candidatus Sabulitectum sp.]